MFGTALILVARELKEPIKAIISAVMRNDREAAKHALVDAMNAGERMALKKSRGG